MLTLTDITCRNCGKVVASAQWFGKRNTRTRTYHEGNHCTKKLEGFRLDRYCLDKDHAVSWEKEYERFAEQNPNWIKYPKRLAHIQAHCPHKHTKTVTHDLEGQRTWGLVCIRCWKFLESEWEAVPEPLVVPV